MRITGFFLLLLGAVTVIYMVVHFFYPTDYGIRLFGLFGTGAPVIGVMFIGAGTALLLAFKKKRKK